MFPRTNIARQLSKSRAKRISSSALMSEVHRVFSENETQRREIQEKLVQKGSKEENYFQWKKLDPDKIFHIDDIQKLCVDYRLRFLDAHYFKGEFPEEAITKIRLLGREHGFPLKNFKLMAPAKLLKLENADDPLLFAPMGNHYFYLIHKWGKDLHPFRKLLMWPFKELENLAISMLFFSFLLTAIVPLHYLVDDPGVREKIILFLFIFKCVVGVVLYVAIAKGKNVNAAIWKSKFYNA